MASAAYFADGIDGLPLRLVVGARVEFRVQPHDEELDGEADEHERRDYPEGTLHEERRADTVGEPGIAPAEGGYPFRADEAEHRHAEQQTPPADLPEEVHRLVAVLEHEAHRYAVEHHARYLGQPEKRAVFRLAELAGVVIPAHKNFADWHAAHYSEVARRIQLVAEDNMAVTMLGHIGIPFRASFEQDEKEVYAVSGAETIDHLSDEELKKLLSRKLLLDGPAAAAVSSRGFSDALGLTAEHKVFSFNRELRTDDGKGYVIVQDSQVPFFTIKDPKAEVFTELHYVSYNGADDDEYIAPATVFYKNALGGYVCSMVFHYQIVYSQFNERRKEFFIEILERLRGRKLPLVSADAQNVTVITLEYSDGALLTEVCNINFDPLKRIALRCAKTPSRVERLTGAGEWAEASFEVKGETVTVEIPLGCYELAVLKLK